MKIKISILIIFFLLCHSIGFSESLNVVTYNVLADDTHRKTRTPKLIELLKNSNSDMWKVLNGNKPGFTWDKEKSYMARVGSFPGEKSRRLDKIYYKSARMIPIHIKIIGDKSISENLFPSDHFGLIGSFKLKEF